MARKSPAHTMDPSTDDLYNERGEEGYADGFFFIENGLYKATLLAEKRWKTPSGKPRSAKVVATYFGVDARQLAGGLRVAGWEPPKNLARLCESAPRSSLEKRRRTLFGGRNVR